MPVSISREQWAMARVQWECDPLCTYAQIADLLGTSRQAVAQQAKRNSWQKQTDNAALARQAHENVSAASDSKVSYSTVQAGEQAPSVYTSPNQESDQPAEKPADEPNVTRLPMTPHLHVVAAGTPPSQAGEQIMSAGVAEREKVIGMHRSELKAVRAKIHNVLKKTGAPDGDETRAIKALAESVRILHDSERRAYGMDAEPQKKPGDGAMLVVNRKQGKTIGR